MKKKIILGIFISFLFAINVNALSCEYRFNYEDPTDDPMIYVLNFNDDDFSKGYVNVDSEYYENLISYVNPSNGCPKNIWIYSHNVIDAEYLYDYQISEQKKNSLFGDGYGKYAIEDNLILSKYVPIPWENYSKVGCGNISGIPAKIPELTNYAMNVIQVLVPVILVIMGSIDLFKGVTAQKEDEIKKGQQVFIKRLIIAVLIFFVIVIVKLLVSILAANVGGENIIDCVDCFLNNKCYDFYY